MIFVFLRSDVGGFGRGREEREERGKWGVHIHLGRTDFPHPCASRLVDDTMYVGFIFSECLKGGESDA